MENFRDCIMEVTDCKRYMPINFPDTHLLFVGKTYLLLLYQHYLDTIL